MSGQGKIIMIINSIPQPWRHMIVELMEERDKAKADLQNREVLAALPEVHALIAQLRDRAEKAEVEADFFKSEIKLRNKILDLGCVQALIAGAYEAAASMIEDNVRHAKDLGREIWPIPDIRALIPADAIAYLSQELTPSQPAQPVALQDAARRILSDDIAISHMAQALHDGPLGADDHWFSAARPQGAWCVDAVRVALRAITED